VRSVTSLMRWTRRDEGQSVGPELMLLLVVALAVWGFLAWLGRLNSTAQDLENTAQSAARAASQESSLDDARNAAERAVGASNLASPCASPPTVAMSWSQGPTGTWRGGSVTVTLTCTVDNTEPITSAGRTLTATDTQVIDRFTAAP
jgi:Flp pilus assembly protein TadG